MATYWENSCSFGLRYVSWYKYLIVTLVFSHLGFWSGNLFLIAPFPDLCLLVPFHFKTGIDQEFPVFIPKPGVKIPNRIDVRNCFLHLIEKSKRYPCSDWCIEIFPLAFWHLIGWSRLYLELAQAC